MLFFYDAKVSIKREFRDLKFNLSELHQKKAKPSV